MDVLLLNDTTFAPHLKSDCRVLSAGPRGHYIMPEQDHFDIWLDARLEQDLSDVLEKCRAIHRDFDPRVIILFETALNYFYRGIEASPALTLWRVVDSHMFYHWQPQYGQLFDGVLVAQRDYLPLFQAYNTQATWLPLNTNTRVHFDRKLKRDIPVSFVGSMNPVVHPERVRFFEALQAMVPLQLFSGKTQVEISEIYNRSQIVINECLHRDLNYRLFEAMSNGALCLTPAIDAGQADLFINGEDIVEYEDKNVNSAADAIRGLFADSGRLERIRAAGYEKVTAHHNISHRVEQVRAIIEELLEARPTRHFDAQRLIPLVSLLGEFTFELRKTGGLHMQEILRRSGELDPRQTAYALTSLSGRWLKRGHHEAAGYFLSEALGLPFSDETLESAWSSLRGLLKR